MQACALIEAKPGSRQGTSRHLANRLDWSLPGLDSIDTDWS